MGPDGSFGMGWMWLWWLLIAAGVVALIIGLVAAARPREREARDARRGRRSAREILDERFARGEIDQEEYRARRRELDEP